MDKRLIKNIDYRTESFVINHIETLTQKKVVSLSNHHFSYKSSCVHMTSPTEKKGFQVADNVFYFGLVTFSINYKSVALDTQNIIYQTKLTFVTPAQDPDFSVILRSKIIKTALWGGTLIELYGVDPLQLNHSCDLLFQDITTISNSLIVNPATGILTPNPTYGQETYDIDLQFNGFKILTH